MTISIVIPVYNAATTIGPLVTQLIDGLRQQSLQVVLVNDGSTDVKSMNENLSNALSLRNERH